MLRNGTIKTAQYLQVYENYSPAHGLVFYHTSGLHMPAYNASLGCSDTLLTEIPPASPVVAIVQHPVAWFCTNFAWIRCTGLTWRTRVRGVSHATRFLIEKGPLITAFQAALWETLSPAGPFDCRLVPQCQYFDADSEAAPIVRTFSSARRSGDITHYVPLECAEAVLSKITRATISISGNPSVDMATWAHIQLELSKLEAWLSSRHNLCCRQLLDFYGADAHLHMLALQNWSA